MSIILREKGTYRDAVPASALDAAGAVATGERFHLRDADLVEVTLDGVLEAGGRDRELQRVLRPVSYTHLDVYKRQAYGIPIASYFAFAML